MTVPPPGQPPDQPPADQPPPPPPPPPPAGWSGSGPPAPMTPDQERTWAIISHVGSFAAAYAALGLLCPLIVLLVKGNESQYVRANAVESLNFQITAAIAAVVSAVLILVLVGIFMLIALGIAYIVFVILGTMAASRGEVYRYPVSIRFVK